MARKQIKTWSTPVVNEEKKTVPCNICGSSIFRPSLRCGNFSYVRCVNCGLVQMNPQPLEAETRQRYVENYGEDYLAYELANEQAFLNLQLLALGDAGFWDLEEEYKALGDKQMNNTPKILDIGCATGSLLAYLKNRGWKTTGVEIGIPQADYARKKRNLDVRSLPLEENNFPGAAYNVIHASHLIEHLNDPAAMVREVRRLLAPGGRFFVTTPNIASFQAVVFGNRWRSAIFDHLYLFSHKTLSHLLGKNSFTVEKKAAWGGLAAGTAPAFVKRVFDRAAKFSGLGDVMIVRARRD